mmetsp:Transcript_27364/g.64323  ORF Transcript_27364/g.64323 Transcript_27364/m.64323 type:complete len:439 (+) Transcript_27364:270-1586(+)
MSQLGLEHRQVLHSRCIGSPKKENLIQEVLETDERLAIKDDVRILDQRDEVNSDILQHINSLVVLEEHDELLLADGLAFRSQSLLGPMQLLFQIAHHTPFLLRSGHDAHDFHKYANEKVHDRKWRADDEASEQGPYNEVVLEGEACHPRHVVVEAAMESKAKHGLWQRAEVLGASWRVNCDLGQSDGEDIHDHEAEHDREYDGACGRPDGPHQDQNFWKESEHSGDSSNTRQSKEPKHSEHRGVEKHEVEIREAQHHEEDPGLQHHEKGQEEIEDEPEVTDPAPLRLEGNEPNHDFDCEDQAKQILHKNDARIRIDEQSRLVDRGLDADPNRIQQNDEHGAVLKPVGSRDVLSTTSLVVVLRGDVGGLGKGIAHFGFHVQSTELGVKHLLLPLLLRLSQILRAWVRRLHFFLLKIHSLFCFDGSLNDAWKLNHVVIVV